MSLTTEMPEVAETPTAPASCTCTQKACECDGNGYVPFAGRMIKKLSIIYTLRCPVQCEHCCYECGPHRNEKCDVSLAAKWALAAAQHGCTEFGLSGGECLLYMDEVLELSKVAAGAGLKPTIATAAFWATSPEAAADVAGKLRAAGVHRVIVSADSFHQKSIPIDRVKNALDACSAASIEVRIAVARTMRDAEWEKEAHSILESYGKSVRTTLTGPVGRWRGHYAESPRGNRERVDVCRAVFDLTVYPNGDVYPCCSGTIGDLMNRSRNNVLRLGNAIEGDLADVLERAERSPIMHALRVTGPNGLLDLWGNAEAHAKIPEGVRNRCELCAWLAEHLDADAVQRSCSEGAKEYATRLQESWQVRRNLFPDP